MATKVALVVRADLPMGRGKVASQVAHAAVAAVVSTVDSAVTREWLDDGQPKIVLQVPDLDALMAVCSEAGLSGLPSHRVADAGRTQLTPGTISGCTIGPAPDDAIDALTGGLRLL